MRYYKITDQNDNVTVIGKNDNLGTEITEAEYNELLSMIREKADLVNRLYNGEITIDEVPTEWREEIQRRVDERIAQQGTAEDQDISADEALSIILGGKV